VLFYSICPLVKAQDTVKKLVKLINGLFGKNSVVKDSSGREYAVAEWQPLLKSGKYSIRPVDFENINDQFIIVKTIARRLSTTICSGIQWSCD